ncbi:MAG TPA: sulfotransferase, partial [Acidimicrobiales bacterium]|nr:sulfotransferase [Acidimicrobiales bacterium]
REAMRRLATVLPDVKVVLSLRHPVDRAYSQYWARRSRGFETRSFAEVIATEPEVPLTDDGGLVARGRYLEQIERALNHIGRDQLLVVLFDDLQERPAETYAQICEFIGADPTTVPDEVGRPANRYRTFRSERVRRLALRLPKGVGNAVGHLNSRAEAYPELDPSLRAALCDRFRPHNAALAEWLGRDLSAWDT